jgi:hypothetical protein
MHDGVCQKAHKIVSFSYIRVPIIFNKPIKKRGGGKNKKHM